MYTCIIFRYTQIGQTFWKIDGWMIQLQSPSSGQVREFIRHDPHNALWVYWVIWDTAHDILWLALILPCL